ncbi:MAG: hypothetical protein KAZ95_00045 [Rhodoluna sp.]|jgi:hypothetical protein|uniref:Unannotated protein n=1 Tax=freshwater metagenome TaxID=449393 RepID=A0A6J6CQL9_9ZZZZ|nr:hypothetical protein [Rhodoluna sp.]MTA58759.1 hypothetical protein [Actinomycetota bacterium]
MGFWGVFWLWSLLSVAALVVFGFIAKSLYNRAMSAAHQAMRLSTQLEKLTAELERKQKLNPVEDSLLADPGKLQMRRRALVKAKIKKQEERQRRLIASLKRFDPNESRFH